MLEISVTFKPVSKVLEFLAEWKALLYLTYYLKGDFNGL